MAQQIGDGAGFGDAGAGAAGLVMRLTAALDWLFPPACAACGAETDSRNGLCPACFRAMPFITGPACDRCALPGPGDCDACAAEPPPWGHGRAAALYDGPARAAILALKHGDRLAVAHAAAPWLLRAAGPLALRADLIAPVPMHWTRQLHRRANQSAELARALARAAGRPAAFAPSLLA
ncbi:MAG: ComF family protein, partial [Rubrimonas sp.]